MRRLNNIVVLTLVSISQPQEAKALESEFQAWSAAFVQSQVGRSPVLLWLDTHARRGSGSTVLIVRPAVGYRFLPTLSTHLGYGWIPNFVDGAETSHEHRIWQQFVWAPALHMQLLLNLRGRLEQRFSDQDGDIGLRFRVFGRANWRFGRSPYVLALWDELFLPANDTDWGQQAGFDQNRIFAGVGLLGFVGMRIEVGYLNVVLNRNVNRMLHALAINLFLRI